MSIVRAAPIGAARIVVSSPLAYERFCGRTLIERHQVVLGQLGVQRVDVVDPASQGGTGLAYRYAIPVPPYPIPVPPYLVVTAERVFDPRLYRAALAAGGPVRLVDAGEPIGLEVAAPGAPTVDLDVASIEPYHRELRRALPPYWIAVRDAGDRDRVRQVLVAASGKGHQEIVARVVHAPIETWLMTRLAERAVTPNQLTLLCNVVAYAVVLLLATGHLAAGVAGAMIVGIVDGLDGRQARVQARTSAFGRIEHLLDKAYEILWIVALAFWLSSGFADRTYVPWLAAWIVAYLADTAAYDTFKLACGFQLDEASRLDAAIRFVGGRRNVYVYMLLAGVIAGAPAGAFRAIVVWAVATAVVHAVRVVWLLWRRPAAPAGEVH